MVCISFCIFFLRRQIRPISEGCKAAFLRPVIHHKKVPIFVNRLAVLKVFLLPLAQLVPVTVPQGKFCNIPVIVFYCLLCYTLVNNIGVHPTLKRSHSVIMVVGRRKGRSRCCFFVSLQICTGSFCNIPVIVFSLLLCYTVFRNRSSAFCRNFLLGMNGCLLLFFFIDKSRFKVKNIIQNHFRVTLRSNNHICRISSFANANQRIRPRKFNNAVLSWMMQSLTSPVLCSI